MCWFCRYKRCEDAISERVNSRNDDDTNAKSMVQKIPCQICGASSSGYHFGVISCEGCKGFFRRSLTKHTTYQCSKSNTSINTGEDTIVHQATCKFCRWNACLRAGMSTTAVRTGRHSIQRKVETSVRVQNLAAENRLLPETVHRRDHQRKIMQQNRQNAVTSYRNMSSVEANSSSQLSGDIFDFTDEVLHLTSDEDLFTLEFLDEKNTLVPLMNTESDTSVERPLTLQVDECGMLLSESVASFIAESTKRLDEVRISRCDPLTFEMNPEEVWTKIVKTSFEPHLRVVSLFIRSLPGFQGLVMADRMRLFSNAYFPILMTILSLDYNVETQRVNYFSLPDFTSRRVFKTLFRCDQNDINEKQFRDAGHAVVQWKPNLLEFGILCGLLFFNPNIPGLEDSASVKQINRAYHLADEAFNQRFDGQRNRLQNFSIMTGYLEQMNQVFALGIENMKNHHPHLLAMYPLFNEVYSLLMAPPLSVEFLRDNYYNNIQQ